MHILVDLDLGEMQRELKFAIGTAVQSRESSAACLFGLTLTYVCKDDPHDKPLGGPAAIFFMA